ncbi:MAG: flavodoxin-dependent (E)-4-hydroxy-3-methylbut-2-enyl-diphosphate synthase [Thermotaleaceae bacterium]
MDVATERVRTRKVYCGNVAIGGDSLISIQSMTTTNTSDVQSTVQQIKELEEAGCEIIRVAVPDMEAAHAIRKIKKQIKIPLVADIHFDYRLALKSIENGADKLRINPGNIGNIERVKLVVEKAKERQIPIRIGVNAGSIEKNILKKYGNTSAEAMVESALGHVKILEDLDFENIIISLKASDVLLTLDAYKLISSQVPYPLHIGVTEAGTLWAGTIKSSVGIGSLLLNGIGDTLRVSLTSDPIEEIRVGREILQTIGMRSFGVEIISCPTCGRCQIDLIQLVERIEDKIRAINKPIKIAIMGCAVNGPGEARDADIGIAGGKSSALLFKKGEIIRRIEEDQIEAVLLEELSKL